MEAMFNKREPIALPAVGTLREHTDVRICQDRGLEAKSLEHNTLVR